VFLQSSLLDETFPAESALQWLLACMRHLVIFSVILQMESLLTEAAFELLSVDMNLLVSFKKD